MDVPPMIYADPALIDTIVGELKSQGTFDQFRKECIADVDTKPAYQNLHQRVESTVSNFLEGKTWRPDLNKNQLRDSLRKHIFEMGFLETGVERIVDQVVNPKVHTVFMPQVEDVVYRVQGIPKPDKKPVINSSSTIGSASKNGGVFSQPPSFLPGLSFLPPALQNHMQKPPTFEDLLPTDLDPVSPESSKDSADGSESVLEESGIIKQHDDSMESQLSGISDLTSHGSDHIAVESEIKNEDLNDDSHQYKVSSSSKVSCSLKKIKSNETEEHSTAPDVHVCHDEVEQTLEESQENLYPPGPVVQYGDQFSMEEEVATTVSNINNEAHTKNNVKKDTNFCGTDGSLHSEETKLKEEENDSDPECTKQPLSCEPRANVVDENSLAQSEDSQFSGSSDNKLLIDEMKDFNSQSGNSHQPEDEQSSMKTSSEGFLSEDNSKSMVLENVVEASEEARHGFEDSQDALERPPLPLTPPLILDVNDRPPLPPDRSPEVVQRPPLPRSPPSDSRQHEGIPPPPLPPPPPPPPPPSDDVIRPMESTSPPLSHTPPLPVGSGPFDGLDSLPATMKHQETERLDWKSGTPRSTTPTAEYPMSKHPCTPPGTPPVDRLSVERPPLPETPPLPDKPKDLDLPPLPPSPPPAGILEVPERPPLPVTPPLAERSTNLECPDTPQASTVSRTPPPVTEEEFSRDSNMSLSYEEGAVPKTPHWEPRSPEAEDERPALSSNIGISDPSKTRQSFSTSPKISINGQDEESQSGSEEMQLAWSPLSNHGDEGNDDSGIKHPSEEKLSVDDASSKDPLPQEKLKEDKGSSSESNREPKKNDKIESEKHRERDHVKDGKSRERRKEDESDKFRKDSSSSSKRHDDRSSKHRESQSSSRSKHDDKNRSDKDRDRHSSHSHRRSDDRRRDEKRDDKERSSSSRHKSSRSDDRHRHRDRDQKHGSGGNRHEDRNHEKSSKSEDRSKSSKSHSSDRDRKERDTRDKERKVDKDKERSRKDSSRSDEKKREKEREKEKKDKSSNICRPNNDRKSPDPDSNNGSTFGGNNYGSTGSGGKDDHHHDGSNQDSHKGSGSTDSNSKSSDSSQQNNLGIDPPSSSCNQACPTSSSLPLKKRPLVPENEALHELPCGQQLVLKIKKFKKYDGDQPQSTKSRKMKALRRLEKEAVRNLDKYSSSVHKVDSGAEISETNDKTPTKYFESDWPTKSNDKAFLAYLEDLEKSKDLSGLSDWSESDSEDEEIFHSDDTKNLYSGLEDRDVIFSLSLLPDAQAPKFSETNSSNKKQDLKETATKSSNSVKATKRLRQKRPIDSESEIKRQKILSKDVATPAPTEQKSRRARKPNKRYSNDEFTSHFDNEDELDMIEEEPVLASSSKSTQAEKISTLASSSSTSCTTAPWIDNEKLTSVPEIDLQEKENQLNLQASKISPVTPEKKPKQNDPVTTYSWNKDSYNSNSEDEMDSTNTESDLIGTALKNLMMESGLGGPDEVSGSQKLPSTPRHTLTASLSAINTKTIPLSGVKRVGLSRNYKGSKKLIVKPSVATGSCGQFSLPPSPESDVSASSCDKGSGSKLQGSKSDASDLDRNAESGRLCLSRVKQHYSSDDLYKPRPSLRLTSKRSKAVSEQNPLL